jgi:hypothetical protein
VSFLNTPPYKKTRNDEYTMHEHGGGRTGTTRGHWWKLRESGHRSATRIARWSGARTSLSLVAGMGLAIAMTSTFLISPSRSGAQLCQEV